MNNPLKRYRDTGVFDCNRLFLSELITMFVKSLYDGENVSLKRASANI